ncbi:MAG: hypothetical protein EA401_01585 [Planctomycetota bacterium]|nr:MAG: hypothetical protein EA401_01585 [Planctomycetota bacterium]
MSMVSHMPPTIGILGGALKRFLPRRRDLFCLDVLLIERQPAGQSIMRVFLAASVPGLYGPEQDGAGRLADVLRQVDTKEGAEDGLLLGAEGVAVFADA